MKISLLLHNAYSIGGTIRTVFNQASAFVALGHDVEIVSVFQHGERPQLELDERVRLRSLVDLRKNSEGYDGDDPRYHDPAIEFPAHESRYKQYNRLTDVRIEEELRANRADVIVGTRAGLVSAVARWAPREAVIVGQEHLTYGMRKPELHEEMYDDLRRLHAFVTVTEADAKVYRSRMDLPGVEVLSIPNGIPAPTVPPSDRTVKTVVTAGRLAEVKRFDLLVEAWAVVAKERPDWNLRIYGSGGTRKKLRALIDDLRLNAWVHLMGAATPIETEWVKGSIAAVPSEIEPFGMTLVEAMRCGLPVVSTDCEFGPGEILRHGEDGLLVPVGDAKAMAEALLELINDDEKRDRMGRAALVNSERYDPIAIARRHIELFERLGAPTGGTREVLAGGFTPPACTAAGHVTRDGDVELRFHLPAAAPNARLEVRFRPKKPKAPRRGLLDRILGRRPATPPPPPGPSFLLPLAPDADDPRRVTAVIRPAEHPFTEGYWDLYADVDGAKTRLLPGALELRDLARGEYDAASRAAVALLPYRTKDAKLALRCWTRPVHAEVESIETTDERVRFTGHLTGGLPDGSPAALIARCRQDPRLVVERPASVEADGSFCCELMWKLLLDDRVTEHDNWDLWLRYGAAEPVRVGAVLDDVRDKKAVCAYPVSVFEESPRGRVRVRPYFTVDNDLSVNVVDLPRPSGSSPMRVLRAGSRALRGRR